MEFIRVQHLDRDEDAMSDEVVLEFDGTCEPGGRARYGFELSGLGEPEAGSGPVVGAADADRRADGWTGLSGRALLVRWCDEWFEPRFLGRSRRPTLGRDGPDSDRRGSVMPSYLFDIGGCPVAVSPPAATRPRKRRRTPAAHPSLIAWFETMVLLGLVPQPRDILLGRVKQKRERRHACAKYIRKVAGRKYQLRVFWGGGRAAGESWSFGLYDSEAAALQVRRKLAEVMRTSPDPCDALRALQAHGFVKPTILPLWVVEVPGGFRGRRRTRDAIAETATYATPEQAHHAMKALVADAARRRLPARHRTDPVPGGTAAG
jgi:hypothetical protein